MTRFVALAIATAGYSGYSPVAPGTVGSVVGLLVAGGVRLTGSRGLEVGVLLAVAGLGVWAAGVAEAYFGQEDPSAAVIDEVAGMLVTMLWVPLTWWTALAGFLVFRLFDIVKPFPARAAERLPRGWGVMTDDLIAGLYAGICVRGMVVAASVVVAW